MSISFKKITLKNFLSFGNTEEAIDLRSNNLTLILGENLDKGDKSGERNGVGKSSIVNAIHYGLFGKSIGNKIKVTNLVNKINKKNMEVSISFEKNGNNYCIERGRSPNYLRFKVNNKDLEIKDFDESQGESKETQKEINKILNIDEAVFNQTILLTTYVDNFLQQPSAGQKDIIENLLGITLLSEKSDLLKEKVKETDNILSQEQVRYDTIKRSNDLIIENSKKNVESLILKASSFEDDRKKSIEQLQFTFTNLDKLNIEDEISKHNKNKEIADLQTKQLENEKIKKELDNNIYSVTGSLKDFQSKIDALEKLDIDNELVNQRELEQWNTFKTSYDYLVKEIGSKKRRTDELQSSIVKDNKKQKDLEEQHASTKEKKCPTCKQQLQDHISSDILSSILNQINEVASKITKDELEIVELVKEIEQFNLIVLPEKPKVYYPSIEETYQHQSKLQSLKVELDNKALILQDLELRRSRIENIVIPSLETTFYKNLEESLNHKNVLQNLKDKIEEEKNKQNPYTDQIEENKEYSLQDLNEDVIASLKDDITHQKFLLNILSDKKSWVRKSIIEKNISFLNNKLCTYLERMGSLHEVLFNSDLSVTIEKYGSSYDFISLSRGERARVSFALTLAFRDMLELLNDSCNLMCVDEILDNGLDPAGVECAFNLLKDISRTYNKNIWIVSHREELIVRISNIVTVTMENNFSSIKN